MQTFYNLIYLTPSNNCYVRGIDARIRKLKIRKRIAIYFGQFLNMSITLATEHINLKKIRSGDINLLVFKFLRKPWSSHIFVAPKYNFYSLDTRTSCVYFATKVWGMITLLWNIILRSFFEALFAWYDNFKSTLKSDWLHVTTTFTYSTLGH